MAISMSDEARAAMRTYKREYMRRWRAANPDRVQANNARYWQKKAALEKRADSGGTNYAEDET